MFDFEDDASTREKCFTSVTELPAFVDPKQIPSKKVPFSTISNYAFLHTIEAILPEETYKSLQASLDAKLEKLQYARVFMSPADLLEHEFFNTYIKAGDILMISEGLSGSDNVFTLRDGILKIELGKEIFERTGLTGTPIRSGGRKHGKERFVIELNLRLPSMLHGKKGFERIERAFKHVLNQSLAWLFCDLHQGDGAAIKRHHPQVIEAVPQQTRLDRILAPPLSGVVSTEMSEVDMQEACGSLSEWIAMVQLRSPRVSADDDIDSFLSRYTVPEADQGRTTDLISLKWHGLISAKWIMHLFVALLGHTSKSKASSSWFVLSASALGKQAVEGRDGFTIAAAPNMFSRSAGAKEDEASESRNLHAICWEYMGATATNK
ncbi:uncharacterized protein N7443_004700 [Penicillium atrosanguineum]|uniref:Uncharacterized protein n=1 Tax=Penicillium atrosanguineum TaxID=1132637 RepID=A0A9W9Q4M0_9EURO|nr:uncharacterized protein N7443_004700 [Penicillium atrosanguineum]KAJ5133676.1 hypothetical protein N7526_005041 [Penicillium atrosanguineum]KAJ5305040.1 hypothetical protein N7443_004700 [Penicillium atrosanguineum]KAJ5324506.1 hypothetical protein N7476_003106 [Penicillium atrosanguineum]